MKKCCLADREIPVSELRQQIEYARVVSEDINKVFLRRTPEIEKILSEYGAMRSRISMLQDFLFQAQLWCDTLLPKNDIYNYKEEE